MITHPNRPHLLVVVLCLFAFGMSLAISRTVFERLPHLEDEYAYLFQARTLARGDLVIPTPLPRRVYWQPFVVDQDGTRFGKYTPGWALLMSAGTITGGEGREWIVNALLAALTVALVYRIGRDLFGRDAGLIGAALTAFSPMALLLNATLMGHTAALCAGVAALWAYLRVEQRMIRAGATSNVQNNPGFGVPNPYERVDYVPQSPPNLRRSARGLVWALACGLALGLLAANRPITGAAFALPLVLRALSQWRFEVRWLTHHVVIAAAAVLVFLMVPIYNVAAVGDPTANLYKLVWEYDCVGFATCGRSGHTLEKAFRHTRFDLSLTAVDLFGWGIPFGLTEAAQAHLVNESDLYPIAGFSMILLPIGIAFGLRRRWWIGVGWFVGIAAAVAFAVRFDGGRLLTDPRFAWAWVLGVLAWTVAPLLLLRRDMRGSWTWLLWSTAALLIGLQLTYWIGSQRYSTRYYFEGLAAAAILSAIPLGTLASRLGRWRWALYGVIGSVLVAVLATYSLPRVETLRAYNRVTRAQIVEVDRRRDGRDALVIVTGGDVRWRAYGGLMASTSPYLDSPIVAAFDFSNGADPDVRADILARFPDRVVIDIRADVNEAAFVE
ncbi:MAG: glycosyltransferase family 39 protein [Chloroflexota bacterium]|nr:glycosyltransferase family 39 protein [Chloroflexota bacterium]